MEITPAQIEDAFKIGTAAASGGLLWKIIDVLSGRRKQRAESDSINMDSAMKLVQALNRDLELQKTENKLHRDEYETLASQYEAMRMEMTDLKIVIRSLYSHIADHMKTCTEPLHLPNIPISLREDN